ncbi:MAG TPA: helix-turn-helix transcriptional regulator [Gaiellaceae bacterium]|nr:helix-turn-helix transcriptional regulator [Gaiellaceae bacterium]
MAVMVPTLTRREHQVASLLAYGYTNSEVAEKLGISVRTAEMHRANAMRKLGAASRADIVRWALDNELLQ